MNSLSIKPLSLFFVSAILSSCASMPDVVVSYYLPKSDVNITVTQTIMCKDADKPIVQTSVDFKPIFYANVDEPKPIDFDILDTFYSSGDATVTLTKDGRFASFNSSSTGSGTEVVDTIITVISGVMAAEDPTSADISEACNKVNDLAGKNEKNPNPLLSVTLSSIVTFDKVVDKTSKKDPKTFTPKITNTPFTLKGYPKGTYEDIVATLGSLSFSDNKNTSLPKPITDNKNKQSITVVEPANIELSVIWKAPDSSII